MLGIDIGGSGIKGAPVDLERGVLAADRVRIDTPAGALPKDVAKVVAKIVHSFSDPGEESDAPAEVVIGCTFPAVIRHGIALTASNVDHSWIGLDTEALFTEATGRTVHVLNDADAAGLAEMRYGAGRGRAGTVVLLTLGTGIGSAVFVDGILVPNTEFGHIEIRGKSAESRAAESVREDGDLSWSKWAKRLDEVIATLETLLCPDLFILGGGVSKKAGKFLDHLQARADIVPAALQNEAGIVGAALAASAREHASPSVPPPDRGAS